MSKINTLKHLLTSQNAVLVVALLIALGWVWGSVNTMQRNYELQQQVDQLDVDNDLLALETETLALEQAYLNTDEYVELRVREDLGLAAPGEQVIMLPKYEPPVSPDEPNVPNTRFEQDRSNLEQWVEFFFRERQPIDQDS